ncbi:MAG: hypothetical protein ACYDAE_15940 [Steroidobacteraceae bacterium]
MTEQLSQASFADRIVSFGDELDAGPNAFLDWGAVVAEMCRVLAGVSPNRTQRCG